MRNKTAITKRFSPWAWLILIVLMSIFIMINYAGSEGLNPTDEGVVLAQSWRIFQGEVPHVDFISIRPVASGYLHTIHFFLPFPIIITARYFVLFQFFIIAFCWTQFFRLNTRFKHDLPIIYQISILLIGWIFGIYNYIFFSWTTIDALFWSSIGFYNIQRSFNNQRGTAKIALGLFAFTMAALSRQTFALVAMFGYIWAIFLIIKNKRWKNGIIGIIIGLIPAIIYAAILIKHRAINDFLAQILSGKGFFDTAFISYVGKYIKSEIVVINTIILILSSLGLIIKKSNHKFRAILASLPVLRVLFILETFLILYLLFRAGQHFISQKMETFKIPFLAFWILFDMFLLNITIQENTKKYWFPVFATLFTTWVSGISYGCKTPVFALGISTIAIIWFYLKKYQDVILLRQNWLKFALPTLGILFVVISVKSGTEVNYRDLGKSQHTRFLNEINPDFGKISTNKNNFQYFKEADQLINVYKKTNTYFVIVPDNAILYPIYRLSNKLPIDWVQSWEMPIQTPEEPLNMNDPVNQAIQQGINKGMIFIVQKIDARFMADGFEAINTKKYQYLQLIENQCKVINETSCFKVYQEGL